MNLYFSCSLTGGRDDEAIYGSIVRHLLQAGHEVPTAHLAEPTVMELEALVDPQEVYERDLRWIEECDALIAEVSTPSHGVGYEIAYALGLGKPVLCCFHQEAQISKMITGNQSAGLVLGRYADESQALALLDEFLESLNLKA